MPKVTVVHPQIAGGAFIEHGPKHREVLQSDQDAVAYTREILYSPLTTRTATLRKKVLRRAGVRPASLGAELFTAPDALLSSGGFEPVATALQPLGLIGSPTSTDFYEHIDEEGEKLELELGGSNVQAISDLHARGWGDRISSVDTGLLVVTTVLFEHVGFGGERLVLLVDDDNLIDDGWNDRASSVAIGGVTLADLLVILGL